MHFTHESRYLHAQLSRAAVIVQPGHFNWSAVLVPVYKPRNGFTMFDRLMSNFATPGRGGSMPAFSLLLLDDFPGRCVEFTDQETNSQIKQRKTGCASSCSAPTVSSPIQKPGGSRCRASPTLFTFAWFCFHLLLLFMHL